MEQETIRDHGLYGTDHYLDQGLYGTGDHYLDQGLYGTGDH